MLENAPWSVDAMREMRREGEQNWEQYFADEGSPTGHLLLYPYTVTFTSTCESSNLCVLLKKLSNLYFL